ncbi:MAG: Ig-like domain-containing protein [Chryseolinea sp.]
MKWIIVLVLSSSFFGTIAKDYYVGGSGASDSNPGTAAQPFATIQKAATVAGSGDVVKVRAGTYRETITPSSSGVTFLPDNGAAVIVSGNNVVPGPWTVHSGNVYKTLINLPVEGSQSRITNNTTILSNQIFKGGSMQFEARWPKISTEADLMNLSKFRHISNTSGFGATSLTDGGLPSIPGGLAGARIICTGWFITSTRMISSQSGNTLNYPDIHSENSRFRKYYYLTGKLGLLTQAKEWHYEKGTLYLWQEGGGAPSNIEYKARNWGFDIRGKSNTSVIGIQFMACEPVVGDANSVNALVDGIKAKYTNHAVMQDINIWPGYGNAQMTGIKLLGANSVIKNSEIQYAASHGVWLGPNCRAENNLIQDVSYEGNWGAGISFWANDGSQTVINNTIRRAGRSCIDLGYSYPGGKNTNINIGYNDISAFGMLNIDLGGIYGWGFRDMTGTRIHHNWVHDAGVAPDPTGIALDGIQTGTYFDQASGPFTVDHNVYWNNYHNLPKDAADHYTQPNFEHRNAGSSKVYNNTFYSNSPQSYVTYVTVPLDVMRNNIYRKGVIINWTAGIGNIQNSLMGAVNPQFNGSGTGGLAYRLTASSPAVNAGVAIAGITDGSVGNPDVGAYELGGTDWIPGYRPVTTAPSTNTPPVVSITAPSNNASFAQGATITITANASDSDGSISRVEFFDGTTKIGESLTSPYSFKWTGATVGTHSITARVTDNVNNITTSAAITITLTGPANISPTVSITSPNNNATSPAGKAITINATAADTNGTVAKVEFFDGATKLGEDTSSPYTFAWINPTVGTHTLSAKATDNQAGVTTATAVVINITAVIPTSNKTPNVSITSPVNSSNHSAGTSLTISALASDADGTVAKVEFFDGANKLGEDTSSPHSFLWASPAVGVHTLTAKATDNSGGFAISANVSVTIVVSLTPGAANNPPTVSITSPANGATFEAGQNITFTANASDIDGSVSMVEFYAGAEKIGEAVATPYTVNWVYVEAGSYKITAIAIDNLDEVTTSSPIDITVSNSPSTPPTIGEEADLYSGIPRFFSPNADGAGDLWVWSANPAYVNASVQVYNRAGQSIYQSFAYDNSWDGRANGQPLQDGDYYYIVRLADLTELRASVRIIR